MNQVFKPTIFPDLDNNGQVVLSSPSAVFGPMFSKHQKLVDPDDVESRDPPNPVVTGGLETLGLKIISPVNIPRLLLMHPALPRGIEIKANRMVRLMDNDLERNIAPFDSTADAKEAREYCKKILNDSGGPIFVKKYVKEAYRFGDAFSTAVLNEMRDAVLFFQNEHPIFFGISKYDAQTAPESFLVDKWKIDPRTRLPISYSQYTPELPLTQFSKINAHTKLVAVGDDIPPDFVVQLNFDTIGDEPIGISLAQYIADIIVQLKEVERAGAQTQVNFGFNKYIVATPFKKTEKLKKFIKTLDNIANQSVIGLPENTSITTPELRRTQFKEYHDVFIMLIATRLGIPRIQLTGESGDVNRATLQTLSQLMNEDSVADEMGVQKAVNEMFTKACWVKFGTDFTKIPVFKFLPPPEDQTELMEREFRRSLAIRNVAAVVEMLADPDIGMKEQGEIILRNFMVTLGITDRTEYEDVKLPEIPADVKPHEVIMATVKKR